MKLGNWMKGPFGRIARGLAISGSIAGGAQGVEARTHTPQDEMRPSPRLVFNEFQKQGEVIDQHIKGEVLSPEILEKYRPLLAFIDTAGAQVGEERQAALDAALPTAKEFADHIILFETMRAEIVSLRKYGTGHFEELLLRREGAPKDVQKANLAEENVTEIARSIIQIVARLPMPDQLVSEFLTDPDALTQGTLSQLNHLFSQFFDPSISDDLRERALAHLLEEFVQQQPPPAPLMEDLPDELTRKQV